jgi:hypothetical protein
MVGTIAEGGRGRVAVSLAVACAGVAVGAVDGVKKGGSAVG